MSLYPSLEDMKVDQMMKTQTEMMHQSRMHSAQVHSAHASAPPPTLPYPLNPVSTPAPAGKYANLYPSLDDYMGLKLVPEEASQVSQHAVAPLQQTQAEMMHRSQMQNPQIYSAHASAAPTTLPYPLNPVSAEKYANLYPSLEDYMGLNVVPGDASRVSQNAVAPIQQNQVAVPSAGGGHSMMVAPLSGNSVGLVRAQVSHGIREIVLCKDGKGKVGLRVQAINKGVFVILVQKGTPAALAGLRFGDQVLMIDDVVVAGFSMDKVHDLIRKANPQKIAMVVRDRPFERTITVHKDSLGNVGFGFKNGKIISLVKDSSAARNGLLIDHNMLEVNGQNVVGLKDKEVTSIIKGGGNIITLTIMPSYVYDHLIKHTAASFLKKTMDHSIPDI